MFEKKCSSFLKTKEMLDYISSIEKGTCVNAFQQNQIYCLKLCNMQFTTLYFEKRLFLSIHPYLSIVGNLKKIPLLFIYSKHHYAAIKQTHDSYCMKTAVSHSLGDFKSGF